MKPRPWTTPAPLVATNLTKSFGGRVLWHGIDFRVEPGEMVAVTGPSGTGKTTLLNCVGLLEPLDSGSLFLGRDRLRFNRQRERRDFYRYGVGFLFQNYGLVESWTVVANLDLALVYSPLARAQRSEARAAALDTLEIAPLATRKIFTLSGGEQQRVALARLLLQKSALVLADEPTAALDDVNARAVVQKLASFRDRGAIVLVSTHDPKVVSACDRQIDLTELAAISGSRSVASMHA